MIVVDTSALMAIVLMESNADDCISVLADDTDALISAGTLAEALIVALRRGVSQELRSLLDGLAMTIVPVSEDHANGVATSYAKWGKGIHPAGLNFGDCFSYELAKAQGCDLLYVGNDFNQTDLARGSG